MSNNIDTNANNNINNMSNNINSNNGNSCFGNICPIEKKNFSSCNILYKNNSIINSKRINKCYIKNINFNKKISEIPKNKNNKKSRINNILGLISNNESKLNELKAIFGNNIELQLLDGDINDEYINKIENFLFNIRDGKSAIPLSKRFQIHSRARTNSNKKSKKFIKNNDIDNDRLLRQKLSPRKCFISIKKRGFSAGKDSYINC